MLQIYRSVALLAELHNSLVLEPRRTRNKVILRGPVHKRVFDIVFSIFVIIFMLSWLIPVIALLIKLESKGPTFFKQLRTGKDGLPFYCFKFRSMAVNAEADLQQASKADPRITKVGAFLRKTSLDELPQFLNVFYGEMSVVGPRPHMLCHTHNYSQMIDGFMDRHAVVPGITGLAQVCGYRGETKELESMANRVKADIGYIRNWSFLLDLKIVLLTVWQLSRNDEKVF